MGGGEHRLLRRPDIRLKSMQTKYWALWLTLLVPACASALAKAPELGLLEFLGTVDSESREWNRYLVSTSPDKAVTSPVQSVPVTPATPAKATTPAPPAKTPVNTPSNTAPPASSSVQSTPAAGQPVAK